MHTCPQLFSVFTVKSFALVCMVSVKAMICQRLKTGSDFLTKTLLLYEPLIASWTPVGMDVLVICS